MKSGVPPPQRKSLRISYPNKNTAPSKSSISTKQNIHAKLRQAGLTHYQSRIKEIPKNSFTISKRVVLQP